MAEPFLLSVTAVQLFLATIFLPFIENGGQWKTVIWRSSWTKVCEAFVIGPFPSGC